jgi:hypothetical protein
MSTTTEQLIDSFAAMVRDRGVPIRGEDNTSRLRMFEEKLPKRMPQSFESFLTRYSFPAFDGLGITLFGWDSDSNKYIVEASAPKNSLSELLIPAGYVQIGRPDTGDFASRPRGGMIEQMNRREFLYYAAIAAALNRLSLASAHDPTPEIAFTVDDPTTDGGRI